MDTIMTGITIKQIQAIYHYLKKHYPASLPEITTYEDLMNLKLSHMKCKDVINFNKILDITGITHVELNSIWISIEAYASRMTRFTSIDLRGHLLQDPTKICSCNLPSYTIQRVNYNGHIENPTYLDQITPLSKAKYISDKNHFTLSSFAIDRNVKQLSEVISRIWKLRDTYSTLHFHLEGNGGGDLIPVHLLMLCLCGGHQRWMTEYEVIEHHMNRRNIQRKWNPWTPWDPKNDDYISYKKLGLDETDLFHYKTSYKGKIILYIDPDCRSSTWFFITYLINAFSSRIERFVKYLHGVPIKCGRASGQIEIHGCSGTTSGDGNAIHKKFILDGTSVTGWFPTQENISRPVQERDWNRFWME